MEYQRQVLQAGMFEGFADKLSGLVSAGTTLLVQNLHRLFTGVCSFAVRANTTTAAIASALRTHSRKVNDCIEAEEKQSEVRLYHVLFCFAFISVYIFTLNH